MGKNVCVVLLIASSMFLVGWYPAMTPDQRIEMQSQWGWSQVETDLGNDGTVDEIVYCYYDHHGRLVREIWDTSYNSNILDYYYDAYGKLEHEEWDYGDDGRIDEVYSYVYDPSGMLTGLYMDYNADNRDDAAVYYYYSAVRLVQKDSDYELDGNIDEVTEYTYDQAGRVIQADHYSSDPARDSQTTYYYYDASGNMKRQEEDYENDGLIDYISLYNYDTWGRPYQEIDDDVNDSPRTDYRDAVRYFYYGDGSDWFDYGDDYYGGVVYDDGCFMSTIAADHGLPQEIFALVLTGLVLSVIPCARRRVISK